MKKYLIIGLGNIGEKYNETRHNIGFKILDSFAKDESITFETQKLGDIATYKFKGRVFVLLKPNTYMNLSGKAVKYWMTKEKISIENVLVICDDLNIPYGSLRLKPKGSAGGHNGLKDINDKLNTQQYARLRFGVGNSFSKGRQVDYVLGKWNKEELLEMPEKLDKIKNIIKSFGLIGVAKTMNEFNKKP
ncbi:MAG TPA: aminoacyl-tRNA hydrolase [Flavobacteriaceae bacterium]|nr:aminoacyl-tRNA hydrolase [Flavobacteriaceae bacterium]